MTPSKPSARSTPGSPAPRPRCSASTQRATRGVAHAIDGGRVLDVACGDGNLLSLIRELHPDADLSGLDMSPEELAAARRRLGEGPRLVESRAEAMPFDDGEFDAVVSHMALMIMDGVEQVIAEVARVLRAGGTFAFVVGTHTTASPARDVFFEELDVEWKADGLRFAVGDKRMRSAAGIAELLGPPAWTGLRIVDFEHPREVPADEVTTWLQRAYYPAGLLSPAAWERLVARLNARMGELAPDGVMHWSMGMRLAVAQRG